MLEDLAKERLEKENLEEKIKELKKIISEHPDRMREAIIEAVHKAIEDFKTTEVKELKDKASDIASSTIIFNIASLTSPSLARKWSSSSKVGGRILPKLEMTARALLHNLFFFLFLEQCGLSPPSFLHMYG
ncbi:hypothetical protein PanWU01x14_280760, partial [Parasponia andersonii]